MFSFRNTPKPSADAVKMSKTVTEMANAISKRRRELTEGVIRGLVAGGFCTEHHVEIVTMSGCGCEGVHVLPFGVAFWTCQQFHDEAQQVTVHYGWGSSCMHGAPTLGLSAPAHHAIIGMGDTQH